MGTAVSSMPAFKANIVYMKIESGVISRYTIIESLGRTKFFVLHTDYLRINEIIDHSYFDTLTIERLFDIEPNDICWFGSVEAAIQAHDKEFEN